MKGKIINLYKLCSRNTVKVIFTLLVVGLGVNTVYASKYQLPTMCLMGAFIALMLTAKFFTKRKLYRYLFAFVSMTIYFISIDINSISYLYVIVINKWSALLFCYILLVDDYVTPLIAGLYPSIRLLMLIPDAREGKYPIGQITGTANGQICITVTAIFIYNLFARLLIERNKFRKMSITDSLTGLATFSHTIEIARQMLESGSISVLVTDMDRFKQINDTYGHIAGNKVIIEMSKLIKEETKGLEAIIGRLGGDEFIIVARNDGSEKLLMLGESLLESVKNRPFVIDPDIDPIYLSFSVGQANSSPKDSDVEKLIYKADVNMYYNKYKNHRLNIFVNKEKPSLPKEAYELLNVLAERDMYTYVHSSYTAQYAVLLARELGFSDEKASQMYTAGWLHDVGKVLISSDIVRKADKLTSDEYSLMKNHINHGLNILQNLELSDSVIKCIQYHHENWNGTGYPAGLSGDQIPLEARILQVADSYSAMTIKRVYRKTLMPDEALDEIVKYSGSQFDPEIVGTFENLIRKKLKIA